MDEAKPDTVLIEAFELLREGEVAPWLEIYAAFPQEMRAQFPDVVRRVLNLSAEVPLAMLVAPLYGEEPDPAIRRHMISRVAQDPCEDSATILSQWRLLAPEREERALLRSALAQLARRGVHPPRTAESRLLAWISSADGMGSYHVVIEIRTLGAPVFLAYAINVEAGMREAERFGAEASDFLARFGDESGLVAAAVSPAYAVREIREAARRCEQSGRSLPVGWTDTLPWLDKIPAVSEVTAAEPAPDAPAPRLSTRRLAQRGEYESWFLPPVAELRRNVRAYLASPERGRTSEARDRRELMRRIADYVAQPRYCERLASMLRHQARIYALRHERAAERAALRSAREVARGQVESGFLRVFVERSLECLSEELLRVDPLPCDDRRATWREVLRPDGSIRRADVVRLDFVVLLDNVLATELDLVPLAERPTEDQLIDALSGCGALVVQHLELRAHSSRSSRKVLTRGDGRKLAAGFTRILVEQTSLRRSSAAPIARVLAEHAWAFANDVCGEYCVHECPARLGECGRALFEHAGAPARLDAGPSDRADPSEERESVFEDVRRAVQICRRLGLEDPRLDALITGVAKLGDEIEEGELQAFRLYSARALRAVLRHTLRALPRLHPSSDPATRGAWERFARAYPSLPVELVSRMIARCSRPTELIALLFTAAEPLRDLNEAAELASAAQILWNATPRPELDGKTPNQAGTGLSGG